MADVLILYDKSAAVPIEFTARHQEEIQRVAGGTVHWCRTEEEAVSEGIGAEILFLWGGSGKLPETYCLKNGNLKWIHTISAGVDPFLQSPIRKLPVRLTNAKGIHGATMALTTIGYIISFLRDFPGLYRQQQLHLWEKPADPLPGEAAGLTVCILGAGAIGAEVARLSQALGMRVLGVKRNAAPLEHYDRVYAAPQMDEAIAQADFLVVLTPLTPETRHLVDADRIAKLKPTSILINISRGPVVDEAALIEALQSGRLAGAALDATETEPLPADSPLWDMKQVIITPHCSAASDRYMDRAVAQFCDLLDRYEHGAALYNEITLTE